MTNRAVVRYTAEVVKAALQIPPHLEITAIQFNPALHCYEVYLVGKGLPFASEGALCMGFSPEDFAARVTPAPAPEPHPHPSPPPVEPPATGE